MNILRAERPTAFGVSVQLCDDDGTDVDFLLESFGLPLASLTNRCVHHEYYIVGFLEIKKNSRLITYQVIYCCNLRLRSIRPTFLRITTPPACVCHWCRR